jgi:hypothetical protein
VKLANIPSICFKHPFLSMRSLHAGCRLNPGLSQKVILTLLKSGKG